MDSKQPTEEERREMKARIDEWLSAENLNRARGKTRREIFNLFDNSLKPIAYVPARYLKYLDTAIEDNRVFSGMGYFIDHALNHHPEVDVSEYEKIQDIIDNNDDVKIDDKNSDRNSLVFIKRYGKYGIVIVSVYKTDDGKLVFHKSYFTSKKIPYKSLRSVRDNASLVGAASTISPADASAAAGNRLSALSDNLSIGNKNDSVKAAKVNEQ
jgi:hypothetical protein